MGVRTMQKTQESPGTVIVVPVAVAAAADHHDLEVQTHQQMTALYLLIHRGNQMQLQGVPMNRFLLS